MQSSSDKDNFSQQHSSKTHVESDQTQSERKVVEASDTDLTKVISREEILKDIASLKERNIDWLEIYKIIVDTRKFEIDNFWKRTVFFWGTIAILLAGYFNSKSENYLIFISYIGLFYNFIFSLSLRGSKFWQEHWEYIAPEYEKALRFRVFHWQPLEDTIKEENKSVFPLFRAKRFSVSKLTMILSDITIFLWFLLVIKDGRFLYKHHLIHFDWGEKIHFFTVAVVITPILFSLYICAFLWRGKKDRERSKYY